MRRNREWWGAGTVGGMLLVLALTGGGCRGASTASVPAGGGVDQSRPRTGQVRVVALGDSLTAGYGLEQTQAYPALIESRLRAAGYMADVVNAGVSGDTSAGGLRRVEWALDGEVHVLIVALGGNDALRGLPPADMHANLAGILDRARARGIRVILAGIEAPPNLGPVYVGQFRKVFRDLADDYDVAFLPFLLDGVAARSDLNQADGIHPNAAGAVVVANNLWPLVERAVREATSR